MFGPLTRWYLGALAAGVLPPLGALATRALYTVHPWDGWVALAWAMVLFSLVFVGGGLAGLVMHGVEMAPPRGRPGWGRLGTQLAVGTLVVLACMPLTMWILAPML